MARPTSELEHDVGTLLKACIDAYSAYSGLTTLAANLHLLALNAEFAAGRAGQRGLGMRVLTQRTREFGRQLAATAGDLVTIRTQIYQRGARAMMHLRRLEILQRAVPLGAGASVAAAMPRETSEVAKAVADLTTLVAEVGRKDRVFGDFTKQSHHIATAIAIEAAAVGSAGAEFVHVADTMKGYVASLGTMVEKSTGAVGRALELAQALSQKASSGDRNTLEGAGGR